MDCIDRETAVEFLDERVGAEDRLALETHLSQCESCSELVSVVMQTLETERPPPQSSGTTKRAELADVDDRSIRKDKPPARNSMTLASADQESPDDTDGEEGKVGVGVGELVGDRYRIQKELGRGGMGSVWIAEDLKLRRAVAIKIMSTDYDDSPAAHARFEREALAVARLRSPYVVQLYDYGIDQDQPYMVMELLEGLDLDHRLRQVGRLSIHELVRIIAQAAKGLSKAHKANIVHRDLKPGNIFLAEDGDTVTAKVVDFGIAKPLSSLGRHTDLTDKGDMLGTPAYMSPEQVHGAKDVDHRTDLWSLAVIAYKALTGRPPFSGTGYGQLCSQILIDEPKPPSQLVDGLTPQVDAFFVRGLAKLLDQRFQSASELVDELYGAAASCVQGSLPSCPNFDSSPGFEPDSVDLSEGELNSTGPTLKGGFTRTAGELSTVALARTDSGSAELVPGDSKTKRKWVVAVGVLVVAAAVGAIVFLTGTDRSAQEPEDGPSAAGVRKGSAEGATTVRSFGPDQAARSTKGLDGAPGSTLTGRSTATASSTDLARPATTASAKKSTVSSTKTNPGPKPASRPPAKKKGGAKTSGTADSDLFPDRF